MSSTMMSYSRDFWNISKFLMSLFTFLKLRLKNHKIELIFIVIYIIDFIIIIFHFIYLLSLISKMLSLITTLSSTSVTCDY